MKTNRELRWRAGLGIFAAKLRHRLRGEEGGSLVEFALVTPLMLTILTGTASFSLAFYNLQQMATATESAVQAVAATQGSIADPCNLAMTTVEAALPSLNSSRLSYNLTITASDGTVTSYPSGSNGGSTAYSCTPAGDTGTTSTEESAGTPVVLTISYQYGWMPVMNFRPQWSNLVVTQAALAD
jgi:Flp pilus assembly protein TadG